MKRYDLMHEINGRGTFMVSQTCLPYLLQSKNKHGRVPHILNNAPPLDMRSKWFSRHVAYTNAKYNMSLCTLGMAEEFKNEIAVNSIWPKYIVWTAAAKLTASQNSHLTFKPEIMADTAYGILCKDTDFTGNFIIDHEFLMENMGLNANDINAYQVDPSIPIDDLMIDFFLPERYDRK